MEDRRGLKIIAIILLVLMFPVVLAIPLAIFVHPAFLLLLLVLAFAYPFVRAVRRT
jgi:hypothetical protein